MSDSNPILDAKMRMGRLRAEFEARKEREWAEINARAQADLDDAVWRAKNEDGLSVYAIAKMYGTTNRNTIYNILARAQEHRELLGLDEPTTEAAPAAPYTLTEADDEGEHWLITHNESGAGAWVRKRDLRPTKSVGPGRLALDMVDRQHVAWQYVPKSEENN